MFDFYELVKVEIFLGATMGAADSNPLFLNRGSETATPNIENRLNSILYIYGNF
jgi:hypothetical protein